MSTVRRLGALALAPLLLAGCQNRPEVTPGPGADLAGARRLLIVEAVDRPIPLVVDRVPAALAGPAAEQDIATLAARAVPWSNASFAPVPLESGRTGTHLVFRFADAGAVRPEEACAGGAPAGGAGVPPPGPPRLHAVLCNGPTPVADVTGVATGSSRAEAEQLVTDTTARLFPDYGQASGGRYPGVSIFGGVGIGSGGRSGGGLGVGLGF
ncbi:MAG TPA: hypothetical protein VFG43_06335 [Geminicoccaceae bacterium]|nr:hypothetical protein [Geminicoccaceae bacterium]